MSARGHVNEQVIVFQSTGDQFSVDDERSSAEHRHFEHSRLIGKQFAKTRNELILCTYSTTPGLF